MRTGVRLVEDVDARIAVVFRKPEHAHDIPRQMRGIPLHVAAGRHAHHRLLPLRGDRARHRRHEERLLAGHADASGDGRVHGVDHRAKALCETVHHVALDGEERRVVGIVLPRGGHLRAQGLLRIRRAPSRVELRHVARTEAFGGMGVGAHVVVRQDERRLLLREQRERVVDVLRETGVVRAEPHLLALDVHRARPVLDVLVDARPVSDDRLHEHAEAHAGAVELVTERTVAGDVALHLLHGGLALGMEREGVEHEVASGAVPVFAAVRGTLRLASGRERHDVVEGEVGAATRGGERRDGGCKERQGKVDVLHVVFPVLFFCGFKRAYYTKNRFAAIYRRAVSW